MTGQTMRDLALRVRELVQAADRYRQATAIALGIGVHETTALERLLDEGPLTPTVIAEQLGMTTASVTGLLDRLAAAGYLARSPNPQDRRSVLVNLTEEGRRVAELSFDLLRTDLADALAGAGRPELTALTDLVRRAAGRLRERAADPAGLGLPPAATGRTARGPGRPGTGKARLPD